MPIQIQNVETYALNPTEQLLYLCSHRPQNHSAHQVWVVDALTLLRHPQTKIDWARLLFNCRHGNLLQRTHNALTYLSTEFDAPIPRAVLETLRVMPLGKRTIQTAKRLSRRIWRKSRRSLASIKQSR